MNDDTLWRRGAAGWISIDSFTDVTAINDMAVLGNSLYLATSPHGKVWRREVNQIEGIKARKIRFGLKVGRCQCRAHAAGRTAKVWVK